MKRINKRIIALSLTTMCLVGGVSGNILSVRAAEVQQVTDYSTVFDAKFYYSMYPDLQQTIGKDADALLKHFVEHGMKEGRVGNAAFQVKAYMVNNLDLMVAFGNEDLTDYYLHYIERGKEEGRACTYKEGQQPAEGVMGTFTTLYDPTEARAINVELAASRINGMIIEPGQSFSYSKSVGTRTVENGYVDGPSYAYGKKVTSIGGGICQVSSTMYVAMVLAGIEATEHHSHSLDVDYVPVGLDAAIAENLLDLRFKNTFDHDIVIDASAADGVLTVAFRRG